jgi:hypothetical protein
MAKKSHHSITALSSIGIDIGKDVFHVVGFDPSGAIVLRRKIRRLSLVKEFAKLPRCVVGMEGVFVFGNCIGTTSAPASRIWAPVCAPKRPVKSLHDYTGITQDRASRIPSAASLFFWLSGKSGLSPSGTLAGEFAIVPGGAIVTPPECRQLWRIREKFCAQRSANLTGRA